MHAAIAPTTIGYRFRLHVAIAIALATIPGSMTWTIDAVRGARHIFTTGRTTDFGAYYKQIHGETDPRDETDQRTRAASDLARSILCAANAVASELPGAPSAVESAYRAALAFRSA